MGVGRRIRGLGFVRVPEFGYTQMYPETNPILDTQALILSGYATLHPETSSMLLIHSGLYIKRLYDNMYRN